MKSQNKKVVLFLIILFICFFSVNSFDYELNLSAYSTEWFYNNIAQNVSNPNFNHIGVNLSKYESFNGNISYDGMALVINYGGGAYQGITLHFVDICGTHSSCLITPQTRIIMDVDCTSNVLGSLDRKSSSGFVRKDSSLGILPYNLDYAFFFKTKSDLASECRLIDSPQGTCTNGMKRYNFSIEEFISSDNSCIIRNGTAREIQKFTFSTEYQGINKEYFYYLKIMGLSDILENNLPSLNVSLSENVPCINESIGYTDVNISINASDNEGDTIYYSSGISNFLHTSIINNEEFSTSDNKGDFGFFTRGNYISNNSYPVNALENNLIVNSFYYLLDTKHTLSQINNNIVLTTTTDAERWFYDTGYNLQNSSFGTFVLGFPQNNTQMSIVSYDSFNTNLINISINYSSTQNLFIYADNTLIGNLTYPLLDSNFDNFIIFTYYFIPSDGTIRVLIDLQNVSFSSVYSKNISYDNFRKFGFFSVLRSVTGDEIRKPLWILDNLNTEGVNYYPNLAWSIVKPTSIRINNTGVYFLDFFATDSVHLTTEYNQVSIPISVVSCEERITPIDILPTDYIGFGNALKETNFRFCSMFNSIRTPSNINFDFCSLWHWLVYLIAVIIAGVFITIALFVFPSISAGIGLIAFSLVAWVGSVFIVELSTTEKIILSILMVFGVVLLLMNILSGDSGHTSNGSN